MKEVACSIVLQDDVVNSFKIDIFFRINSFGLNIYVELKEKEKSCVFNSPVQQTFLSVGFFVNSIIH